MGFGDVLGLAFEITADPEHAVAAMELFQEQVAESLGVSTKNFKQFQDATVAAAKDLAMIGAGVAGVATGMLALAEHAAEVGNEIYEAGEKTGMSAVHLSAINALAKETGGSFDALTVALARAGVNLQNALIEPGELTAKVLAKVMGGAQNLANLGLQPMDDRIQTVLHHIFALNDAGEREQALQALMGRGWQQNVEVLKMLAEQGYAPAIEKAKEFGVFFDTKSAADAHTFTVEVHTLKSELSGLGLTLGRDLIPWFSEWLASAHAMGTELKVLGLRAAETALAVAGPLGLGPARVLEKKATELETHAIQEQTDWLIKLQKEMKSAADSTKDFGNSQTVAAGAGAASGGGAPKDGGFLRYGPSLDQMMAPLGGAVKMTDQATHDLIGTMAEFELAAHRLGTQELPLLHQDFTKLLGDIQHTSPATVAAAKSLGQMGQAAVSAAGQVMMAANQELAAYGGTAKAMKALLDQEIQALASYLAKKADLRALDQIAEAVSCFAAGDYVDGAKHLAAAAAWAALGGAVSMAGHYASGGGGGGGGSASATGGNQSTYGGAPGTGGPSPGGGGGGGATIVWNQYGPSVGTMNDFARGLVPVLNQLGTSGQVRLVAYKALTNGPKQK